MKRQLEAESENFETYKGQKILRGDVVVANVYFENQKRAYRKCDVLYEVKKDVFKCYERKGRREVLVSPDIIDKILVDEFYYRRRNNPEKRRFYWE